MAKEEKRIMAVKGFDSQLKCRDFQYEIGKEYVMNGPVKICMKGFHAINPENTPLSVFDYYPPSVNGKRSRYCEVGIDGDIQHDEEKIAGSIIKVGAEIGIPGLIKAHFDWVKGHITNENNAEEGKAATAGDYGAATAGD